MQVVVNDYNHNNNNMKDKRHGHLRHSKRDTLHYTKNLTQEQRTRRSSIIQGNDRLHTWSTQTNSLNWAATACDATTGTLSAEEEGSDTTRSTTTVDTEDKGIEVTDSYSHRRHLISSIIMILTANDKELHTTEKEGKETMTFVLVVTSQANWSVNSVWPGSTTTLCVQNTTHTQIETDTVTMYTERYIT